MTARETIAVEGSADTRKAVARIEALDLDACRLTYFVLALNEFEKAAGHRFEQWPDAVRTVIEKQIARFHAEHPRASIRAITQAVSNGSCLLALHWSDQP